MAIGFGPGHRPTFPIEYLRICIDHGSRALAAAARLSNERPGQVERDLHQLSQVGN